MPTIVKTKKLNKPQRRKLQLERKVERRMAKLRNNPLQDKYGRPIAEGSPIGAGDKNWIKNYGVGGTSSAKTPILGIGIARDSYLPQSYIDNERNARRVSIVENHTPRSTKLTREVKHWANKYKLDADPEFMSRLIQVTKRVKPLEYLRIPSELLSELKPMIYKFSSFNLQDKRQANAHFGHSTREQMSRAQLFESMKGESTCESTEATYDVKYTLTDKSEPSVPLATTTRTQMLNSQLFKSMGNPGGPSQCNPETPYLPKFDYLSSEPSSVSARFGKAPGSDRNDLPVWKKIAKKRAIERLKASQLLKQNKIESPISKSESSLTFLKSFSPENETKVKSWQTPVVLNNSQQTEVEENDAIGGSLDCFLLPKLTTQKHSPKAANYSSGRPTPQRFVKNWNKRHAKPIVIKKRKPKPDELADVACSSHLATIERCQPTQWLSPFGGDDHNQHLHATAGTLDSEWMGDEWLDEDEDGNIIEEKLLEFNESTEETIYRHVHEHDNDSANDSIAMQKYDNIVEIEIPPEHGFPINYIARRSDFFGKSRLNNKLAKHNGGLIFGGNSIRNVTSPSRITNRLSHSRSASGIRIRSPLPTNPGSVASNVQLLHDGNLNMSHRTLKDNDLSLFLSETEHRNTVTQLVLDDCRLNDQQSIEIIEMLQKYQRIKCLDLSNNKLGIRTANALSVLSKTCHSLCELYISGSFSTTKISSSSLLKNADLSRLIKIDISHNRIDNQTVVGKLAILLKSTQTLEYANFGWNNIGPKGSLDIARALYSNRSLKYLDVSFNGFGSAGALLLAKAIGKHPKLETLYMDGNVFGDTAAQKLRDSMMKITKQAGRDLLTKCTLSLCHNKISKNVAAEILRRGKHQILEIKVFPLIVGDGEGSTDPTVSLIYQVPK